MHSSNDGGFSWTTDTCRCGGESWRRDTPRSLAEQDKDRQLAKSRKSYTVETNVAAISKHDPCGGNMLKCQKQAVYQGVACSSSWNSIYNWKQCVGNVGNGTCLWTKCTNSSRPCPKSPWMRWRQIPPHTGMSLFPMPLFPWGITAWGWKWGMVPNPWKWGNRVTVRMLQRLLHTKFSLSGSQAIFTWEGKQLWGNYITEVNLMYQLSQTISLADKIRNSETR